MLKPAGPLHSTAWLSMAPSAVRPGRQHTHIVSMAQRARCATQHARSRCLVMCCFTVEQRFSDAEN
eukprot:10096052-Alexandrium_andersonii.AAC.1